MTVGSAGASLQQLMYAVNQYYEDGLYFSYHLAFCEDAVTRVRAGDGTLPPADPERIAATAVTFTYPGTGEPALTVLIITHRLASLPVRLLNRAAPGAAR